MKDNNYTLTLVAADFSGVDPHYDYELRFTKNEDDDALLFAKTFGGSMMINGPFAVVRIETKTTMIAEDFNLGVYGKVSK